MSRKRGQDRFGICHTLATIGWEGETMSFDRPNVKAVPDLIFKIGGMFISGGSPCSKILILIPDHLSSRCETATDRIHG